MRTRVSRGRGPACDDPALWNRIWRHQLALQSEAEFWEVLRTRRPANRGAPSAASQQPGIPAWLFEFLVNVIGLPENDVLDMTEDQAMQTYMRHNPSMIERGEEPPDFELPDQDGRPVKLSDFRGRQVVVYFYPKADTPGCTTQACGVRDHRADYANAGAAVLGISPDPVAKAKEFHDKYSLDFALLADEDHRVAESYGVWVEKSMYGRTYWGVQRTTFVIDPEGVVSRVLHKVKPAEHDALALAALQETNPPVV